MNLLAGHGVDAAIGERCGHDGDVARGDQNRALPEIGLQHRVDIVLDDGGVAQQIADSAVAVAGHAFGRKDRLVDSEFSSGKSA